MWSTWCQGTERRDIPRIPCSKTNRERKTDGKANLLSASSNQIPGFNWHPQKAEKITRRTLPEERTETDGGPNGAQTQADPRAVQHTLRVYSGVAVCLNMTFAQYLRVLRAATLKMSNLPISI